MLPLRSILATGLCLALGASGTAAASFPGRNGPLVVAQEGCAVDNAFLESFDWESGRRLRSLTPRCSNRRGHGYVDVSAPQPSPRGLDVVAMREYTYTNRGAALVRAPVSGGPLRALRLPRQLRAASQPTYSPDGRHVAFGAGNRIWRARADGTGARPVTAAHRCRCFSFERPRWSPGGAYLAALVVHYNDVVGRRAPLREGLWLIRVATGEPVRRLVPGIDLEFDWSPDGAGLVYATPHAPRLGERGGASGGDLHVVSVDGRQRRELVRRDGIAEVSPAWSPDGEWIAWISLRPGPGVELFDVDVRIWRVPAAGGEPVELARRPGPDVEDSLFRAPSLAWLPGS